MLTEIQRLLKPVALNLHKKAEQMAEVLDKLLSGISARTDNYSVVGLVVAKGGFPWASSVLSKMQSEQLVFDIVNGSRYNGGIKGKEEITILDSHDEVANKTVVIFDDLIDEGLTMEALVQKMLNEGANEVIVCVMGHKDKTEQQVIFGRDFSLSRQSSASGQKKSAATAPETFDASQGGDGIPEGFSLISKGRVTIISAATFPDEFLVGCGMDCREMFRNSKVLQSVIPGKEQEFVEHIKQLEQKISEEGGALRRPEDNAAQKQEGQEVVVASRPAAYLFSLKHFNEQCLRTINQAVKGIMGSDDGFGTLVLALGKRAIYILGLVNLPIGVYIDYEKWPRTPHNGMGKEGLPSQKSDLDRGIIYFPKILQNNLKQVKKIVVLAVSRSFTSTKDFVIKRYGRYFPDLTVVRVDSVKLTVEVCNVLAREDVRRIADDEFDVPHEGISNKEKNRM